MKSLQTMWTVGLVFIYNMLIVDHVLALITFASYIILLGVTVWFSVILHAFGPPSAEDNAYSAFVI
jgi:hypothetical protein